MSIQNGNLGNLQFKAVSDMMFNQQAFRRREQEKSDESLSMNKQTAMKLQMMEEKLKNLEEKSSRLEVINKNLLVNQQKRDNSLFDGDNEASKTPAPGNPETVKMLNEI